MSSHIEAFDGRSEGYSESSIWEEEEMPTYDYSCEKCGRKFSVFHSIMEHAEKKVSCPKCKSRKVERTISGCFIKTSKKS